MELDYDYCLSCYKEITNANRSVTESCGHSKCRSCFISEENICGQCPQPSQSEVRVLENILISSPEPKTKKTIKEHIIIVGDQYKCLKCDKEFRSRQQQYYHRRCDEPEECRPFKCKICSRGFLTQNHLKYHKKTHSPENIYCNVCKKEFSNKITFNKHLKRHKQHRVYKCDICHLEYRDKTSFRTHETSHGELSHGNSILCNICGKKFIAKSQLRKHSIIHKKDRIKLFKCKICSKKFFRASTLKNHMQKHDSLSKFKCDICFKYFTEDKALRRHHINLHDVSATYQCKVCDAKINRKDNLIRHIRNMHPDHPLENNEEQEEREKSENPSEILVTNNETCEIVRGNKDTAHTSKKLSTTKVEFVEIEERSIKCNNITVLSEKGNLDVAEIPVDNVKCIPCSVIRSVGNAKPLNVVLSPRNTDKNLPQIALSINPIHIPALANKKLKKKYDPTEIYRKILFVNTDDDPIPGGSKDVQKSNEIKFTSSSSDSKNATTNLNDETTCSYSNFIEKHWRKNFYS